MLASTAVYQPKRLLRLRRPEATGYEEHDEAIGHPRIERLHAQNRAA